MSGSPFNRNTTSSFSDRFGKFMIHPAVQGTAAVAPALLAVAPLMIPQHQPHYYPPPPPPAPPRQPHPQQGGDEDGQSPPRQHMPQQMQRLAEVIKKATAQPKVAIAPLAALNAVGNVLAVGSMAKGLLGGGSGGGGGAAAPAPRQKLDTPGQQEVVIACFRGALKKAVAGIPGNGVMAPQLPEEIPSVKTPSTVRTPKQPGAGNAFKPATFMGTVKEKAKDFGSGAADNLAVGLNKFLTPTTDLDPSKFHAMTDSTPLR